MNLADGVDLEELIMSKDELSGADIKVSSHHLLVYSLKFRTSKIPLTVAVTLREVSLLYRQSWLVSHVKIYI